MVIGNAQDNNDCNRHKADHTPVRIIETKADKNYAQI